MRLIFIANDPSLAAYAVHNGADRIMIDLEVLGKEERQGHLDTLISRHEVEDVGRVRRHIADAEIMVRINPLNVDTPTEIAGAVAGGADILMLPMFRSVAEVSQFVEQVAGRARICLLAETVDAINCLPACAAIDGVDEIHIGLNDLSIELGVSFMFSPLVNGYLDTTAEALRRVGKPFGIGGLARVSEGRLPAELIIGEHVRLGSTAAILSRTFHRKATTVAEIEKHMNFAYEVRSIKSVYDKFLEEGAEFISSNHWHIRDIVDEIDPVYLGR